MMLPVPTSAVTHLLRQSGARMEGDLGAPKPPPGLHRGARAHARGRRCSRANTPACRGAQWSAHRGSFAAPGEPVWPVWLHL
jgi:hypothetical protein